jgi:hypothetical protein
MGLNPCPSPAPRMEVQASGDVNNNNNAIDHQARVVAGLKNSVTHTHDVSFV